MNRITFFRPLFLVAISSMAILTFAMAVPAAVHADGVSDGLDKLKTQTGNSYPTTVLGGKKTAPEILGTIINIMLGIGFAIAVVMVIYGGYQYITSAGNEEKATSGRQTIFYALIGLVIIVLSFVIVSAVLNFVRNGITPGSNTPVNNSPANNGT